MSEKHHLTRREFIRKSGNLVAAGSVMALLPSWAAAAAKPITVGFIYVGPRQDFGWNQSHWDAAKKIAKMDGVKVVEQENVPETAEVEKVMESMIQLDGAKVIFATSFGYWKHQLKLAPKHPDVLFVHIAALWKQGDPINTIGFRGYTEEPHYLCGMAAGRMTKTNKIGFLGSKPLYFIFNNCNGFVLGARSVNPAVTCNVVITGDWNNPVKEPGRNGIGRRAASLSKPGRPEASIRTCCGAVSIKTWWPSVRLARPYPKASGTRSW